MATLEIVNNLLLDAQGIETVAKQGAIANAMGTAHEITVTGNVHRVASTLATATVVTVFDDDDDVPADWDYLHFWADVDMYLQIVAGSTSVVFKILAKTPFNLPGYDGMLAAASASLITGGTEPTLTDIDSIAIGNYSGSTGNYILTIVD